MKAIVRQHISKDLKEGDTLNREGNFGVKGDIKKPWSEIKRMKDYFEIKY